MIHKIDAINAPNLVTESKRILCFHFWQKQQRPAEPVYAEPIKSSTIPGKASTSAASSARATPQPTSDEYEEVQLRPKPIERAEHEPVTYENTSQIIGGSGGGGGGSGGAANVIGEKARHSDPQIADYANQDEIDGSKKAARPLQRKYHSKSFSLSENRVAASLNMFQQNRELWEKRTEMQSQPYLSAPRYV